MTRLQFTVQCVIIANFLINVFAFCGLKPNVENRYHLVNQQQYLGIPIQTKTSQEKR
jgi:hypothetical protein